MYTSTVVFGVSTHSVPSVDHFFRVEWTAAFPLCTIHCVLYTVYYSIEFRSGFPLWTQHHCVITPKSTEGVSVSARRFFVHASRSSLLMVLVSSDLAQVVRQFCRLYIEVECCFQTSKASFRSSCSRLSSTAFLNAAASAVLRRVLSEERERTIARSSIR